MIKLLPILLVIVTLFSPLSTSPTGQLLFLTSTVEKQQPTKAEEGHFSHWSKKVKREFLNDLRDNKGDDWIIVMGNEGGDLDSMVAALTMAFYYNHLEVPQKAVALLQTEMDALDLRPENKISLEYAKMAPGHRDLLTIDELPIKPWDMSHRVKGLALVDHNVPRAMWEKSKIISVIDHHEDGGNSPDAFPRIITTAACCSSLVANFVLDELEKRERKKSVFKKMQQGAGGGWEEEGHGGELPKHLVDLLLRTIAIDSSGLKQGGEVDLKTAERLFKLSSWSKGKASLRTVMKGLDRELNTAKKALDDLSLRDLLRRDWKADSIPTLSKKYPEITVGFASISASMNEMILRTPEQTTPEWFAIERAYTAEAGTDVSVVLNNHRDTDDSTKAREIALVVAHGFGNRLSSKAADSLFACLVNAIEDREDVLGELEIWERPDGKELLPRRKVWIHYSGSNRKVIRPIIEKAIREWRGRRVVEQGEEF